jgi:hypothetical protein
MPRILALLFRRALWGTAALAPLVLAMLIEIPLVRATRGALGADVAGLLGFCIGLAVTVFWLLLLRDAPWLRR